MERLVKTGIAALDLFLKGGLPPGFTSLLLAPSGSGSEVFAKQFSCGHSKERVLYISTDESAREVDEAAHEAGWSMDTVDVMDVQTDFADAMLDAQQQRPTQKTQARSFDPRDLVEGTSSRDLLGAAQAKARTGTTDYLGRLIEPYSALRRPDRVVVHSLDFYLNLYPIEQVAPVLTAMKAANARGGGQLLWVLSKGAHGATVERRLEMLADCLLELEVTRKGTSFERFFMVKKVKNRAEGVGVSTYEIRQDGFNLETLERIV